MSTTMYRKISNLILSVKRYDRVCNGTNKFFGVEDKVRANAEAEEQLNKVITEAEEITDIIEKDDVLNLIRVSLMCVNGEGGYYAEYQKPLGGTGKWTLVEV